VSDFLSRNPYCIEDGVSPEIMSIDVKDVMDKDLGHISDIVKKFINAKCTWYLNLLENVRKHPEKFPLLHVDYLGLLCKKIRDKTTKAYRSVYIVPTDYRKEIASYHHNHAHFGVKKVLAKISENFLWGKMCKTVKEVSKNCLICQGTKKTTADATGGQMTIHVPKKITPCQVLYLDYVGELPSDSQNKYLLTAICSATNWMFIMPCRRATAANVVKLLETEVEPLVGRVQVIVTDSGSAFVSKELETYLQKRRVTHHFLSYYSPWTNKVERSHQDILRLLRIWIKSQKKWVQTIPSILYALRTYKSTVSGFSPAELFLGYQPQPPWEIDTAIIDGQVENQEPSEAYAKRKSARERLHEEALRCIEKYKKAQQKRYNVNHKEHTFAIDEIVWLKSLGLKSNKAKGFNAKLAFPWRGLFKISEIFSKTQYGLSTLSGQKIPGRHHCSHLKKANIPPDLGLEEIRKTRFAGKTHLVVESEDLGKDDPESEVPTYNLRSRQRPE